MIFCLETCACMFSCFGTDSVNQESGLLPINWFKSHLPIPGTSPG
ncbi:hypothetical protein [Bacillus sp. AFS059628]|nr:hypothetical protein [Bacillus sp. AFS059628]